MSSSKNKRLWKSMGVHFTLLVFAIIAVYPVLQVVTISLRPGDKLLSTSLEIIPEGASLRSYVSLFTERPFLLWLTNSALISLTVTLTGVVLAAMSGYVFSRFAFIGKKIGLLSLLVTQMFPATMLLLPLYIMLIN